MKDKRAKIFFINDMLSTGLLLSRAEISRRFEDKFEYPLLERTFYEYINALEDEEAPIQKKKVGKETFYQYDRDFSLTKNPLKTKDAQKLQQILKLLDQMKGLPQIEDLRAIVKTLEQKANLKAGETQQTILLDHRPMSSGFEWLQILQAHIEQKKVLEIHYQPFAMPNGEPVPPDFKVVLHPYFLKEYQRYWHLFGWNEATKTVQNYALDRVTKVEIVPNAFFKKPLVEPANYFDDIIGVTRFEQSPLETYVIRAHKDIARYWKNRKLHASQKVTAELENHTIFEFKLRWNFEWQNLILYYGKHVTVLEPMKFRQEIQTILKEALGSYENPPIA
jgi:predicted DNA-binding transcriptional regulator YafY